MKNMYNTCRYSSKIRESDKFFENVSHQKKKYDEVIETIPLNLPPLEFETKSVWV